MKKLIVCAAFLMIGVFTTASAQNSPTNSLQQKKAALLGCKNVADACVAAGYYQGGDAKGKGLGKNCVNPILSGQTIAGVKVNNADVVACQSLNTKMTN